MPLGELAHLFEKLQGLLAGRRQLGRRCGDRRQLLGFVFGLVAVEIV